MTKEALIAENAELRIQIEADVIAYNSAITEGDAEQTSRLDKSISDAVTTFNSNAQSIKFADYKETDDPMMAAVNDPFYTVLRIKDTHDPDDKLAPPVREVSEAERIINLLKLDKSCHGIGHDANWKHIAQKLNFALTAQKCKDLNVDPKSVNDSYAMTAIAREYDLGKNPASNTNLLKSLNAVIQAMIGAEFKATSHDVNYLKTIYAKKSNRAALTVSCANHQKFVSYMLEIAHRIVKDKGYAVEFKAKKQG